MKKSRFREEQMVTILREADRRPVPEVAKQHGVSAQTIYSWRKHFGTLEPADVKRLRQLEQENITTFLGLGKLGEEFAIPPERCYFLNDGDSLDIGDRTVTAIRPPLYDSSATRGLWDPKTSMYFAADCYGVVMPNVPQFADEMPAGEYEDGFFWMNRANHIWFHDVKQAAIDAAAERIVKLDPKVVVSGHGPSARKNLPNYCKMITRIGDMEPVQMPNQAEFEKMLAGG